MQTVDAHGPVHAFDPGQDPGDCNTKTACGLPTIVVGYVTDRIERVTCHECLPRNPADGWRAVFTRGQTRD